MFCSNCGAQNPDHGNFCAKCGAALHHASTPVWNSPASRVETLAANNPTAAAKSGTWQEWEKRIGSAIREIATAPLFLVMTICYSLVQLLNLVAASQGDYLSDVYDVLRNMGISTSMIREMFSGVESMISSAAFLTAVPGILIAVGLWMIYVSAINRSDNKIQTGGLTMIKCVQIVNLVIVCLAIIVVLIGVLSLSTELSKYSGRSSYVSTVNSALGVITVVLLIVGTLGIVYNVKILTTISRISSTVRTSIPDSHVSVFVAVMCIISGSASVLSLLLGGLSLSGILQGVSSILFGAQLFTYRSKMQQLEAQQYAYRREQSNDVNSEAMFRPSAAMSQGYIPTWKRLETDPNTEQQNL